MELGDVVYSATTTLDGFPLWYPWAGLVPAGVCGRDIHTSLVRAGTDDMQRRAAGIFYRCITPAADCRVSNSSSVLRNPAYDECIFAHGRCGNCFGPIVSGLEFFAEPRVVSGDEATDFATSYTQTYYSLKI